MQLNFTSKDAFQISSRWVWLVLALILLTLSIALSGEVIEAVGGKPELIQNIDENLLQFLASHRITALNSPAIDLTALGSTVALTLLVTFLITYFEFTSQRASSVKLLIVSLGSGLLSQVFKAYVGRVRPDQAFRLVNVGGYSYPSGHSVSASAIYFTIAIIFATQLKKPIQRVLIVLMFLALIFAIAFTRMYLGVHYFSDVTGGILMGLSWAFIAAAAASHLTVAKD